MIRVVCPVCDTKYKFDESMLQGKARGHARCKKCGEKMEIDLAASDRGPLEEATGAPAAKSDESSQDTTARVRRLRSDESVGEETVSVFGHKASENLDLPADKKYSLAVLRGRAQGQIFSVTKTRTMIGRAGTDIVLDDAECSRQHAVLEIHGARATISDLGSTNGTFVDGQRVDRADLEPQSEFRVGDHVLMLIVTDRE